MLFGEKVRKMASEKGLSQAELARKAGMSRSRINSIWTTKTNDPRLESIILIANALDVSVSELVDGVTIDES